ncbi:outer membrane beta-barrel protein [Mariniflexile gromovii]|uniref:Outer membrane beta-barrel protein n=1 Tax=Mariniflexile gromovii TaxID=362523 RepID=A0ABS4BXM1_9FLAO|nr:outer membrane beta-barrel protein [Mariniflexile gromovii]MBP0905342.1 outer membrane beta-barrel protein [Mariniflexile gromovii]
MKKITLFLALFAFGFTFAQAPLEEGGLQLNAGVGATGWGASVYGGVEYGLLPDITIGAEASYHSYNHDYFGSSYDYKSNIIGIQANGSYHFNELLQIPSEFDVYAGANLNYFSWTTKVNGEKVNSYNGEDNFGLGLHAGGRYFFTDNFGVNVQVGGGNVFSGIKAGITYIF